MYKKINMVICTLVLIIGASYGAIAEQTPDDGTIVEFQHGFYSSGDGDTLYELRLVPLQSLLNTPPNIPTKPYGPSTVVQYNWYMYTTVTTDPDNDTVSYGWDGGDEIINYWTPYMPSGQLCVVSVRFLSVGTSKLQVKAKDIYGAESNFSPPLFVTVTSANQPPHTPSNPYPSDQATTVAVTADLGWTGGDPDAGDGVTYDVYFGSSLTLQKVASNISLPSFDPGTLLHSFTYYWKVIAWDNHGASAEGPVWSFTTMAQPNNPPAKPSIQGPSWGRPGWSYTFSATTTDPDNNPVSYWFEWGDGSNTGWVGSFNSGDTCQEPHIWNAKGSFSVKVKTKDSKDAESVWSDSLIISMPKSQSYNPFLQVFHKLMERFAFL